MAHSQNHNKKHQPQHSSKTPSVGSDNKKQTGRQAKGKTPHPHVSKPLPSNWDRYGENLGLDSEEALTSSSQPTEFVLPKSKGADYAHLISEAKDQSSSSRFMDVSHLFGDVITDFTQDFGPMLISAKGQSLLSWAEDDDFEFEGKTSTSFEAPFLSLDLKALSEQLAKAKLSERCFLEPDLFPSELLDELQAYDEDKYDPKTRTSSTETKSRFSSSLHNQEFRQKHGPLSSTITLARDHHPVQTPARVLEPLKQENIGILQSQDTARSISRESVTEEIFVSTAKSPSIFEAVSAEAELDMLLSSLGETKIVESKGGNVNNHEHAVKSANIDDDIDKLLEETSYLTILDGGRGSNEVSAIADARSSALNADSKSKLLDDFDSWLDTI
ncbi:2-oxoglutarate (2OG) and Fe(II)-dependent oxygenase superfamily protein [Striga asiatica]|uniref:2-oxoglutarate (2OG) and Fe(II)-dependent oxygenase superfamily protein n=1 Tax=Striga asiatica TaxID=4170 RepID=A0A5A7QZ47_STRAF|nr:2-oxoglutarate (2OG) and Fe(II)-dependent oxygenase superfamily protein [Striga asiatica]